MGESRTESAIAEPRSAERPNFRLWGGIVGGAAGALILASQAIEAAQKLTVTLGGASPRTLAALGVVLVISAIGMIATSGAERSKLLRPESFVLSADVDTSSSLRGRDRDLRDLVELCGSTPQVFLYGDSGVGKTALLRAGLWHALRSSRSLFPIYLSGLSDDLSLSALTPIAARIWTELSDEQRAHLGLTMTPTAIETVSVLRRIEGATGRKPLLILDQFDDFLSRNAHSLMTNARSWISSNTLVFQSPFWRSINDVVSDDTIHMIAASTSEFAVGFRLITFGATSETYALRRVDAGAVRSLLLDLAGGSHTDAVSRPERGWKQLQEHILRDIAIDGRILPAQLRVILGGLGSLRALTVEEYLAAGRAEGLESLYIDQFAGECAGARRIKKRTVIVFLSALVNPDEMKTQSVTAAAICSAIHSKQSAEVGPDIGDLTENLVEECLGFLAGRNGLVRVRENEGGRSVYSLRHDYLCRGVVRARRDVDRRGELLSEKHRQYRERNSGLLPWWRALLPLRMQATLLAGRVRGEFHYDHSRRYVLVSLARAVPALAAGCAYVALADVGVLLPGQTVVQRALDRHGLSVFRRPRPMAAIKDSARSYRAALAKVLLARERDGLIGALSDGTGNDPWAHAQSAAALARAAASGGIGSDVIDRLASRLFRPETLTFKYGWADDDLRSKDPAASPAFLSPPVSWTGLGLAEAFRRRDAATPGQAMLAEHLAVTLQMLQFYTGTEGRGWTLLAGEDPPQTSVYATALATMMLLSIRSLPSAPPPPTGMDEKIKTGVDWLVSQFEVDGGSKGWRETRGDGISEGLTFQVFATLLRYATTFEVAPPFRNLVRSYVPEALMATRGWSSGHTDGISYLYAHSRLPGSPRMEFFRATSLLWYPWAIDCAAAWLQYAGRDGENSESAHGALSHLVVTLQPEMRHLLDGSPTYRIAEALYALSAVETV